jgi:hypothetical protein
MRLRHPRGRVAECLQNTETMFGGRLKTGIPAVE